MTARPAPLFRASVLLLLAAIAASPSLLLAREDTAGAGRVVTMIKPSRTDPAIRRFDHPHHVYFDPKAAADAHLVVFMPGTGGKPANLATLLDAIAGMGYRVIGLEYNNTPAVVQICRSNPDPQCSGQFREERIYGEDVSSVIDNTAAESIVNRLTQLLRHLDEHYPDQGWGRYLINGAPDWRRIVVSGLSQGAGMAAYIAKKKTVARVVLFSSPWDFFETGDKTGKLAPWIAEASATPPERWFGAYHRREGTAALLAKSYAALKIPDAQIRVLDGELANKAKSGRNPNPFHSEGTHNPAYAPDWEFLFGAAR